MTTIYCPLLADAYNYFQIVNKLLMRKKRAERELYNFRDCDVLFPTHKQGKEYASKKETGKQGIGNHAKNESFPDRGYLNLVGMVARTCFVTARSKRDGRESKANR